MLKSKLSPTVFFILLLVCFSYLYSQPASISHKDVSTWKLVPSPTRSTVHFLFCTQKNKIIAAGRELVEYNGTEWVIPKKQPPINSIDLMYMIDRDNIWFCSNTTLNDSELYLFDGKSYKKVNHPLANHILKLFFYKNKKGWIVGDREIAYYDGKKWDILNFPFMSIRSFIGIKEKTATVISNKNKLWIYNGNEWHQHLGEIDFYSLCFVEDGHFLALSNNLLYEYKNSKWRIHSSLPFAERITNIFVLNPKSIWASGINGFVCHYNGTEWKIIKTSFEDDVHDLLMLSDDEGWCSGDNGNLYHYSKDTTTYVVKDRAGFDLWEIVRHGSEISDEYGVAIDDINGDGLKDIYAVCIFEPNRLYINYCKPKNGIKEFRFKDEAVTRNVTALMGDSAVVSFSEIYLGAGLADVDNDGDLDLYLCDLYGTNELFLNNGSGYFRPVSLQKNRACSLKERTNSVAFGDIDNDGDLDLFIANEQSTNRLFINDGLGYFNEITEEAGLKSEFGGTSASFGDIDGDNDLDLVVVNWSKPNLLYRNVTINGKVSFENISAQSGIEGLPYTKSNAAVFGDVDNDGDLDLFITNRKAPNKFYLNRGNGTFEDKSEKFIGIDTLFSYGATFGDFDNDGFIDLYVANIGGNIFYKNISGKFFDDKTIEFGARLNGYSTGTAAGDIDNDGDLDLYVANYVNESSRLCINKIDNNKNILIDIEGTLSNRDAVGVKVFFYQSGHINDNKYLLGYREIKSGTGYGSHDSKQVHFGTGNIKLFDVVIYFPATKIEKKLYGVTAGITLKIFEQDGFARIKSRLYSLLNRLFCDPENQIEITKLFIVITLCFISFKSGRKKYNWKFRLITLHIFIAVLYLIQVYIFIHREFFLSTVVPLASIIVFLTIIHLYFERIVMVKLSKIEKQATRDRIARDLHDDLAATLGSAIIYSGTVKTNVDRNITPEKEIFGKIYTLLLEAAESITDIVWTISPKYDRVEDLISRLNTFIIDFAKSNKIQPSIETNLTNAGVTIKDDAKRNIFLIFKEAMHNVVKHSEADKVVFNVYDENKILHISLRDNGKGFDDIPGSNKLNLLSGNGLINIKKRAEDIDAKLQINSNSNFGTEIIIQYKMT